MIYGSGHHYHHCRRRRVKEALIVVVGVFFLIWILHSRCHRDDRDEEFPFDLCWVNSINPPGTGIHSAVGVKQKNDNHLRAIAFGTSRTWGACLEDPNTQAYVKLLSSHKMSKDSINTTNATTTTTNSGINLGFNAGDADLPALCLYSMIRNYTANEHEPFDVIVLEFKADYTLLPFQEKLLHRIRTRFPTTLIVFVELRAPFFFQHMATNQSIREWMTEHGYTSLQDEAFHQDLLTNTLSTDWINTAAAVDWTERHSAMVLGGAHILSFPPNQPLMPDQPQPQQQQLDDTSSRHSWFSSFRQKDPQNDYQFQYYDARKFIALNAKYFCDDWSHPSKLGHEYIADQILQLVANTNVQRMQAQPKQKQNTISRFSALHHQEHPREEDDAFWMGPKDQCNLWVSDGALGQSIFHHQVDSAAAVAASATTAVSRTVGMEFIEFDDWDHRFAAQVSKNGGSIQLRISIVPCDIFVSHMQIGPAVDQYPKTLAWLEYHDDEHVPGEDGISKTTATNSTPVVLDPFYEFESHVTNVAYVGPGPRQAGTYVTIHIKPIQEGMAHPFRITGTIVAPHDDKYLARMTPTYKNFTT